MRGNEGGGRKRILKKKTSQESEKSNGGRLKAAYLATPDGKHPSSVPTSLQHDDNKMQRQRRRRRRRKRTSRGEVLQRRCAGKPPENPPEN
jgi:hypothetical protein